MNPNHEKIEGAVNGGADDLKQHAERNLTENTDGSDPEIPTLPSVDFFEEFVQRLKNFLGIHSK